MERTLVNMITVSNICHRLGAYTCEVSEPKYMKGFVFNALQGIWIERETYLHLWLMVLKDMLTFHMNYSFIIPLTCCRSWQATNTTISSCTIRTLCASIPSSGSQGSIIGIWNIAGSIYWHNLSLFQLSIKCLCDHKEMLANLLKWQETLYLRLRGVGRMVSTPGKVRSPPMSFIL